MIGIIVLITVNSFSFGALHVVIPLLVELLDGTPINLSFLESSLGIGMLISTFILSFVKLNRKGFVSILGLLATLIITIIFSQTFSLLLITVIVFFIGFLMSFVYIPFFAAIQEKKIVD